MKYLLMVAAVGVAGSPADATVLKIVGNVNGVVSSGLIRGSDGALYGETATGGVNGAGSIYRLDSSGVLSNVVSFNGLDGSRPATGLTQLADGSFVGTTQSGGVSGIGEVFRASSNGNVQVLASFENGFTAPFAPYGSLIDSGGVLYGTTFNGGTGTVGSSSVSVGTAYRVDASGKIETVANFGDPAGGGPRGLTLGPDGNFYGATSYADKSAGSIFRLTTGGALTSLATFPGNNAYGRGSTGPLILGPNGVFYGTFNGGPLFPDNVFSFSLSRGLHTLHSFGFADGSFPEGPLIIGPDGALYGAASNGGLNGNNGTVFRVTTSGVFTKIWDFSGSDGSYPFGGLAFGTDGFLYGVNNYSGNIYQLSGIPAVAPVAEPTAGWLMALGVGAAASASRGFRRRL